MKRLFEPVPIGGIELRNRLQLTTADGERKVIPVDTVVIAAGGRPGIRLADSVRTVVGEVFTIGDCVEPRSILEATTDGLNAGRRA